MSLLSQLYLLSPRTRQSYTSPVTSTAALAFSNASFYHPGSKGLLRDWLTTNAVAPSFICRLQFMFRYGSSWFEKAAIINKVAKNILFMAVIRSSACNGFRFTKPVILPVQTAPDGPSSY